MNPTEIPRVGICVLNYHHPEETLTCVVSLLAKEPSSTRVLWLENDSNLTRDHLLEVLATAPFPWIEVGPESTELPAPGTVTVVCNPENLGYAGGNNVGLRLLHRAGVPFAWVLNNDTTLVRGCSEDFVAAAEARPEVGLWASSIVSDHDRCCGGILHEGDLSTTPCTSLPQLASDPLAYVSGCSMFFRLDTAAALGFIPEDYFLYYEDPAFTQEMRRRNLGIAAVETVEVHHLESLSTGHRSPLMEFYSKRNRWYFIQRYFPARLRANRWRLLHTLQKYALRGRWTRLRVELLAFNDFRKGRWGKTSRALNRKDRT